MHNFTTEQQAIINSQANVIVIQALAGSGKSSTLIGYSSARPDWRFIYLSYNKSMAEQAKKKFPANVECMTVHSLAYRAVGYKYKNKRGNNRLRDLVAELNLSNDDTARVKHSLKAVNDWLLSDTDDLLDFINNKYKSEGLKNELLLDAPVIWEMMVDIDNNAIKMPDDGYLKLFAMSKPVLQYHGLLLDEAQDSNLVTMALVNNSSCQYKVIVGDNHQAIYSFRGTINVLDIFAKEGAEVHYLTTCFRFNQKIADYATHILQSKKMETQRMVGGGKGGEIMTYSPSLELPKYTTILARNNFSLFEIAIQQVTKDKKVYFQGGIERYDLSLLYAIIDLELGHKVTHPFISKFNSFYNLKTYAKESEEMDILFAIKLIDEYGSSKLKNILFTLVKMDEYISANLKERLYECHYQLITAHRSKGLEMKKVAVWDDFVKLEEMINEGYAQKFKENKLKSFELQRWIDEVNLYYVAVTRPMEMLFLPKKI